MNRISQFIVLLVLISPVGCTDDEELKFDGQYFRTQSESTNKSDRRQFEVTVEDASLSLTGARQAGEFEAIRYCIEGYGTSSIRWAPGFAEDDEPSLTESDNMILVGKCEPR